MKRVLIHFLLAAVLLCGCAPEETVHSVDVNYNGKDMVLTVDTENRTVSDGRYTYSYTVSGNTTTVTYPNGATYYETGNGNLTTMGWSEDYDESVYLSGSTLLWAVTDALPQQRGGHLLPGLLLIALGAFDTFAPYAAWYICYGWHYQDAEPSDASLTLARVSGVIIMGIGLCLAIF